MGAAVNDTIPPRRPSDAIVINKPLAWSIVTALAAAFFWGGTTISDLRNAVQATNQIISEVKSDAKASNEKRERLEQRVQDLERSATRTDTVLATMAASIGEVKVAVNEMNGLLREISSKEARNARN